MGRLYVGVCHSRWFVPSRVDAGRAKRDATRQAGLVGDGLCGVAYRTQRRDADAVRCNRVLPANLRKAIGGPSLWHQPRGDEGV